MEIHIFFGAKDIIRLPHTSHPVVSCSCSSCRSTAFSISSSMLASIAASVQAKIFLIFNVFSILNRLASGFFSLRSLHQAGHKEAQTGDQAPGGKQFPGLYLCLKMRCILRSYSTAQVQAFRVPGLAGIFTEHCIYRSGVSCTCPCAFL